MSRSSEWEIGLICPNKWANIEYESSLSEKDSGYWSRQLRIKFNGKNHFHFYLGLKRAIAEFKPDILNVEEEHYSFVTYQVFKIAKSMKIPCLFFAWQNIHKRYPLPFRMIEQYVFRNSALAVVGNDSAEASIRLKGYKGEFFHVPQVGVDISMYQRTTPAMKANARSLLGIDPDTFVVLGAGRIVEEKGFQTLIDAATHLLHRNVKILILGSGSYFETLQSLVDRHKLQSRVTLIPFVPSTEMPKYFKASDVMCLPSLTRANWKEQGPTRVISEAMASGINVLVSDSGELPSVVDDAGLTFREGNPKDLASKIERMMDSDSLRQELIQIALDRVNRKFSAEAVAKKNLEMFDLVKTKLNVRSH